MFVYSVAANRLTKRMTSIPDIENMIVRTGIGDCAAFSFLYGATSSKLFGVYLRVLNHLAVLAKFDIKLYGCTKFNAGLIVCAYF